jgi:hypothetical protein
MENQSAEFKIWGVDNVVYGPVDLPTLISWVKDERVTDKTWVFDVQADKWAKAEQLSQLQMFFHKAAASALSSGSKIRPGMLRRVKVLAGLSDDQLAQFATFMELLPVKQWTHLVRQNTPASAMYLILDGELRVRIMVGDRETILSTLAAGDCFGEMSLFDDAPRSADVLANTDSTLLKISVEAFDRLVKQAPDLAAPFLSGIGKTLAGRIRTDNKRLKDSVIQSLSY